MIGLGVYRRDERQVVVNAFLERLTTLGELERKYFSKNCHVRDCKYNEEIKFNDQDVGGICYFISGLGALRIYDYEQQKLNYIAFCRPNEPYFIEKDAKEELVAFDDNVVYILIPAFAVKYLREHSTAFNQILINDMINLVNREKLFNSYCYTTPMNLRVERILLYLAFFYGVKQEQSWLRLPRRIDQSVVASFARASLSTVNQIIDELCRRGILKKGRRKLMLTQVAVEQFSKQTFFRNLLK